MVIFSISRNEMKIHYHLKERKKQIKHSIDDAFRKEQK